MRLVAAAILVLGTFILVTAVNSSNRAELDPFTYTYVVNHFEEDTHSKNGVASVLLNYRMYDTMFEALILLAAIVGMTQFLPRPSDIRKRHAAARDGREPVDEEEERQRDLDDGVEEVADGE